MAHKRRLFGSIERRPGGYRARYVGVDGRRYDAPHLFLTRIDAEGWLSEVSIRGRRDHRLLRLGAVDIARGGHGWRWWGPRVSTSACGVTGS